MNDLLNDWCFAIATFLPLVGALVMMVIPRDEEHLHKVVALVASLAVAAVGVWMLFNFDFDRNDELQFVIDESWIEVIRSRFTMGIDGIALPLLLLTMLVVPLC